MITLITFFFNIRSIDANDLPKLHSLLLGGLHSSRILTDLIDVIGHQLTTLKIETVLTDIPLQIIGNHCRNLIELQIINGRLAIKDHHCKDDKGFFEKLKILYLFLVQYISYEDSVDNKEPQTALHCLLKHAVNIECVQATGCPTFTDQSLKDILEVNNSMSNLRRFIMTDASVQDQATGTSLTLTSMSILQLFDRCSHLQCVGDLRHWNITPAERRIIAKKVQEKTGLRWISTSSY